MTAVLEEHSSPSTWERFEVLYRSSRDDVYAYVVTLLRGDENAKLANGWRAELVGEPVRKVVAGEAALAFDGRGGLLLEARSHVPST